MKKYDIMSAREPCACTNGERRMSIMIVAKQRRARSADHDIMSAREPMCLHNRRMLIMIVAKQRRARECGS